MSKATARIATVKPTCPQAKQSTGKARLNPRYATCQMCEGTGERGKWSASLMMLKAAQCRHENTPYRGGMLFAAGVVWDDIEEFPMTLFSGLTERYAE